MEVTHELGFRPADERRVGRMRCCAARYSGRSEARPERRFPDGVLRGRSGKPTEDRHLSSASEPRSSAAGAPVTLTRRSLQPEILELRAAFPSQ